MERPANRVIGGTFFCVTLYPRGLFPTRLRGAAAMLLRALGLPPLERGDDASQPVDSIDLLIIGLGLLVVLLVLLRR